MHALRQKHPSSLSRLAYEMRRYLLFGNFVVKNNLVHHTSSVTEISFYSEVFVGPDGGILKEGDTITLPKLARTYERIAEGGEREFYEGELAGDIVKDIQDRGKVHCIFCAESVTSTLRLFIPWRNKLTYFSMFIHSLPKVYYKC